MSALPPGLDPVAALVDAMRVQLATGDVHVTKVPETIASIVHYDTLIELRRIAAALEAQADAPRRAIENIRVAVEDGTLAETMASVIRVQRTAIREAFEEERAHAEEEEAREEASAEEGAEEGAEEARDEG